MILTLETSQDPNIDLKTPSSPLASPILGSIKVLYTAFTYSEAQRDPDNEPPPEYTPCSKHPTSSSSSSSKTINYVSGYRRIGSLEGKYVIDPTMQIPSALLPPLASGEAEEERKHLCLETKTGSIHADVTLVDRPSSTKALVHKSGRVMMEAKTAASGSIFLKIHASDSPTRLRFYLRTYSRGSTTIHLPRSFRGTLTISVPIGHINISQNLVENLSTISEVSHTRRCFVGDLSQLGSLDCVEMDQVCVEARLGNVTLLYDDDDLDPLVAVAHSQDQVVETVVVGSSSSSLGSDGDVGGFVKMKAGILGRLFTRRSSG